MNSRLRRMLYCLAIGLLAALTACTPAATPATPTLFERLAGDWLNQNEPFILHLNADGTYTLAQASALADPVDAGTLTIAGPTWTFTTGADNSFCQAGDFVKDQVEVVSDNEIHMVVSEDSCTPESVGSDITWFRCEMKSDPAYPEEKTCDPVK